MRFLGLCSVLLGFALAAESAWAGDLGPSANEAFLATNATKPGVMVRPSGLQYRIIKHGPDGNSTPTANDEVVVAYKGQLIDGTVFDAAPRAKPLTAPMRVFISGWKEALSLMKAGDEWELVIPANLGYGDEAQGEAIPSNQTLIFDLELLAIR